MRAEKDEAGCWNTICIPAIAFLKARARLAMRTDASACTPSKDTVPSSATSSPVMISARVLLPEPLVPISPTISPESTLNPASSSAKNAPLRVEYDLETPFTSSNIVSTSTGLDDLRQRAITPRDGGNEGLRVGMLGRMEHLLAIARFHQPSAFHDTDAVGNLGYGGYVVAHDEDGASPLLANAQQQARNSWLVTSRALVGSSASRSAESHATDIASTTRWHIPPDSSCGYDAKTRSASSKPISASKSHSSARTATPCAVPCARMHSSN